MNNNKVNVRIEGGIPLNGTIKIVPNKNAVLPAIAASLLTDETMIYPNIPRSPDVEKMLSALKNIGAFVDDSTATVTICCKGVNKSTLSKEHIKDMQAGYLFAGPLLTSFGEVTIPIASGCALGYRGPEGHIEYFSRLSIEHEMTDTSIRFFLNESIKDDRLKELGNLEYPERSAMYTHPQVTPTENILMLLAKTSRYKTKISGIAQEPHVRQLIKLLQTMGATIIGEGSTIEITGADHLKGTTFIAEPDHVDYFGAVIMAAMTKTDLMIEMDNPHAYGIIHMNRFIKQIGIVLEPRDQGVFVKGSVSSYSPDDTFPKDYDVDGTVTYLMSPGPSPAFPVDCLPAFIAFSTMNTKERTQTLVNNWMYRDGLKYLSAMKKMNAPIIWSDDQRVCIGNTPSGNPYTSNKEIIVEAPNVIEGSRAIFYCALAGGDHTINNAQYILRRSPEFFLLHQKLGAQVDIFVPSETEHVGGVS